MRIYLITTFYKRMSSRALRPAFSLAHAKWSTRVLVTSILARANTESASQLARRFDRVVFKQAVYALSWKISREPYNIQGVKVDRRCAYFTRAGLVQLG